MINDLQNIFPSLIRYDEKLSDMSDAYQWFVTDKAEIIGIQKTELTSKDIKLLYTFLSPYNNKLPFPTESEKKWQNLLHDVPGETSLEIKQSPFRFIYFSIKKNQISAHAFKAAIQELFAEPVPILWENEHEGIIVEDLKLQTDERISYEQIIDVLMSDLNGAIHFYVGAYINDLHNIKDYYTAMIQGAKTAFTYTNKPVITYAEAVPMMLIDKTGTSFKSLLANTVLKEFANEEDFLHTLQTFIRCNLNITLTAKELYMHRNSLQYRLDKFEEKTGMDVRQFHEAFTVYLALLANMHKE